MSLTSMDALRGVFSGFRRPLCVRGCRGRRARNPRTDTDGEGGSGLLTVRRSGLLTVLQGHRFEQGGDAILGAG